ncbi:hypothetical protein D9M72_609960 [compost metagenome]
MLWNDGELAENIRKLVIVLLVEAEGDVAVACLFRSNHVAIIVGQKRVVFLHHVEGEDDVFRRHRRAVRPLGLRAQAKRG